MPYLEKHVDDHTLKDAFSEENKHQETALAIAEDYVRSTTIGDLRQRNILTADIIAGARASMAKIQDIFETHYLTAQMRGMTA